MDKQASQKSRKVTTPMGCGFFFGGFPQQGVGFNLVLVNGTASVLPWSESRTIEQVGHLDAQIVWELELSTCMFDHVCT